MVDPRIIVALDCQSENEALALTAKLDPSLCRLKIGKELFTATGPQLVEKLMHLGFEIFLDLKFHDIPNTVGSACIAAARLGVWMLNVHALGGKKMLLAARGAIPAGKARLIAVTLLTSMGPRDLIDVGINESPEKIVQRLALLARDCGLDGVVCSALETKQLRQLIPDNFYLVTPGIRPNNSVINDQQRVTTPRQAIENGSDYLVIGRPITQANDPLLMLQRLTAEINFQSVAP
jgi:orotidine-5'-phosphate decarboxylase